MILPNHPWRLTPQMFFLQTEIFHILLRIEPISNIVSMPMMNIIFGDEKIPIANIVSLDDDNQP